MDKKEIAERLQALSQKREHRSKAAQLRDVMNEIEAALQKGISRKAIVSELAQTGLEMPLSTFDSILRRYRKKRPTSLKNQPVQPLREKESLPEKDDAEVGTSNPAVLDDIINSTPDLAGYARMARESKRKKNS